MKEVWKPVVGYEGLYEVSNLGRVRRVKIIEPSRKKHGYMQISLTGSDGVRKSFRLHRLVAEAFIPNPDGKPQVNHKDEDTENNRARNLEWATAEENTNGRGGGGIPRPEHRSQKDRHTHVLHQRGPQRPPAYRRRVLVAV